ncbi:MAG: glycine--tRNA ligase [Candidatus Micrarchaeia archaeon]|jgi:glycyl-tRNA synthetase
MKKEESKAMNIVSRRAIFYQSFGIYREIGGFYDYGPIGVRIRRNIENMWRRLFVEMLQAIEIETTSIMPEDVFKASGHLSTFTDPMTKCKVCNTPYRADKLLEEFYEEKHDLKAKEGVKKLSIEELDARIREHNIRCEKCGGELGKVEKFNLMFQLKIGPTGSETGYLRPETAQGIFVDFRDLFKTQGLKMPALIAQVGRSYRNEISPRQQLIRMREFTQMELELFFDPESIGNEVGFINIDNILDTRINFVNSGEDEAVAASLRELLESGKIPNKYFALLIYLEEKLMRELGFEANAYRFRELEKEELPHYSKGNIDLEVKTEYGFVEVAGNAYRTDYDLSSHSRVSGVEISIVNNGRKFIPHVVEASMGLDRILFSIIENSVVSDDRGWDWLKLSENVAPYKYAVFPLQKDEKLIPKAKELARLMAEKGISFYYSESGSIGKRYAKADEVGVPYCITIDYQTLEDDTVTIRDRNTTKQVRKSIAELLASS